MTSLPDFNKEPLRRTLTVDSRSIDSENRTAEFSASSELPVERWFGREILDHKPESVRLARLLSDGPLLYNHDPALQIGTITDARVDGDKLRVRVKFSRSELGKEKMQDVEDGILKSVSVGYRVLKAELYEEDKEKGNTYRATDWEAHEVSLVSIPADTSVGMGRSQEPTNQTRKEPIIMSEPNNIPNEPKLDKDQIRNDAIKAERERMVKIEKQIANVEARGYTVPADARQKATDEGWDEGRLAAYCLESMKPTDKGADQRVLGEMQKTEKKVFSLCRVLSLMVANRTIDGFESEVMAEHAKRNGHRAENGGVLIPLEVLRQSQRSMLAGDFGAGGSTVPVQMGEMIDKLDPQPVVQMAGARMLTGLSAPIAFPRHTTAAVAQWVAEAQEVNKSTPGTDDVTLSPHGLSAFIEVSRQLVLTSSIDIEAFVRSEILRRFFLAIDKAALVGPGTDGVPKGIFSLNTSTSGINTVAFGAAPSWAKITEFEGEVEDADGLTGSIAWITSAPVKAKWKATSKDSGSGQYLADGNEANGYPIYVTSQLAGTDFANRVAFGNWSDCVIGMFGSVELLTDQSSALHRKGLVGITGLTHADVIFRQPASFAVSTDAGNQ